MHIDRHMARQFDRRSLLARPGESLSDEALREAVPSIFAAEAHSSRSARYAYIPTVSVLDALRRNGFQPVSATQSRTRTPDKREFTKHLLRLRHASSSDVVLRRVGQVFPEIVLLNSHDGSSRYHLTAGLFRLVCLNGMTVKGADLGEVSVQHTGNVIDNVIEGSFTVLGESRKALEHAERWSTIDLSRGEQLALAESARIVRLGDSDGHVDSPIPASSFLFARRAEDAGTDLWTTFNRVQENAIRGGLSGRERAANGRTRRVSTREVTGIDGDQRINKALWQLAESMAALKN